MKASILITNYNQSKILANILSAIDAQETEFEYEVIITDDGSSSRHLLQIIECIDCFHHMNLQFVHQQDRGFRAARARNNAIRLSQNDIIITLDGDTIPEDPSWLQTIMEVHQKNPKAITYTHRTFRELDELNDKISKIEANILRVSNEKVIKEHMRDWQRAWSFNISFRKIPESLFDENFVNWGLEDGEFCYRLMRHHQYVLHEICKACPVHINHSGAPTSNPFLTKKPQDMINFIDNAVYFYKLYQDDEILQTFITIPDYKEALENGFELHETVASTRKQSLENLIRQRALYAERAFLEKDVDEHGRR